MTMLSRAPVKPPSLRCRHQRTHGGQRRVAIRAAAAAGPPQSRRESDAPSAPAALRLRETLREAARRAAAASTAAVLSASAFLGAPTLEAVAAPGAETSSTTSAATSTTNANTTTTYRLPVVSPDPDVLSVQRVLLQAWDIVDKAFVDGSFGGRDQVAWRGDLVDSLDAAAGAGAAGGGGSQGARLAELAIDAMLDRLGDPYTRRMPARDYESFRQSSEGEIAGGVGLLIAAQPVVAAGGEEGKASFSSSSPPPPSLPGSTGATSSSLSNSTRLRSRLVVLSPIEGGPAARAGIRPGDEVLAIDGHPTDGFDGESAAGMLRGPRGSSVVVDVARREVEEGNGELGSEGMVPGIPGRAPPPKVSMSTTMSGGGGGGGRNDERKKKVAPRVSIRQVRLRREKVELSPVTSSMLTVDEHGSEKASKKSSDSPSSLQQHRVGYLRLASFNARAASDTARALRQMRSQGAEAIVLDLRGNGGGLVRAAVDVSRALLPRGSTIFAVQGRSDVDGSDDDGIDNKRRHLRRLAAMTPPASPEDVVAASSGVPATAITQRVVLDDESGIPGEEEEGGAGGDGGRKNPTALARVMTMLPRLLSASGQRQPSSSSSDLLSTTTAAAAAPLSSNTPLAVLVDRNSASASEILAGALRDNGRAALVGERTYGKGKIQSVFPLRDGSALFVTVARYMTPSEELIDGVGIKPENACRGGAGGGRNNDVASALLASLEMVPGVASESGALQASLSADSCVLTAERLLLAQVEKQQLLQQEQQGGGGGMAEDRRL